MNVICIIKIKTIHSYDMKRTSIQNIIEEADLFCRLEEK